MSPDTGRIYWTQEEIQSAQARNEPLVEVNRQNIERVILDAQNLTVLLTKGQYRRILKNGRK